MFDETEWVPLTTAATRLGLTVADIHDLVHENLIPVKHEPLTPISARLLIRVRDVRAYFAFFAQTAKEDGEVSQARKVELLESAGDAFLATIQQQNEQITRLQEAIDAIAEIWTDQSRDFMVTELVHGRILNEGDMDKGTWTRGHGQGDMDKGTWTRGHG